MIRFADGESVSEIIHPNSALDNFKEIKSNGNISEKDSQQFWEGFFDSLEKLNNIDEKIYTEIYGKSEDEFAFDFDVNDSDVSELIKVFYPDNWGLLDETEKRNLITSFANTVGEKLGIECMPSVEFYEADEYDCGAFIPKENIIKVNINLFDDSYEVLNTIAHETRHAFQFERATKLETYEDWLYAYNFENYIATIITEDGCINFNEYQEQLVEAEARAFANLFTEGR